MYIYIYVHAFFVGETKSSLSSKMNGIPTIYRMRTHSTSKFTFNSHWNLRELHNVSQ